MNNTKLKIFLLAGLCVGYVAITACGGGGSGSGGGVSGQGQYQCYQTATKCSDGSDAVVNDGTNQTNGFLLDKASCPYFCGSLNITAVNTVTTTSTITTTTTSTVTTQ